LPLLSVFHLPHDKEIYGRGLKRSSLRPRK